MQCQSWSHHIQDVDSPVNPFLTFWRPSGNVLACIPNVDGSASIEFVTYTTWDISCLSKIDFSVWRHDSNFRVIDSIVTSHSFFQFACYFLRLPMCGFVGLSWDLVFLIGTILMLSSIAFHSHFFLMSDSLFLKTIHLDTYFCSALSCFFSRAWSKFKNLNIDPVTLNHIFLMLNLCTAAPIQY